MKLYLLLAVFLLGCVGYYLMQPSEDDGPTKFNVRATVEERPYSFDLTGNMRVTLGTLLAGEDQENILMPPSATSPHSSY